MLHNYFCNAKLEQSSLLISHNQSKQQHILIRLIKTHFPTEVQLYMKKER